MEQVNMQRPRKTICAVTGTRAEYGLLRPVLQKLLQSETLCLRLAVTGAHLAPEFGNTVQEIERDGIPIHARLPILQEYGTGTPLATARTTALALEKFLGYFAQHRPDAVLVLGDRYEIFAAGQAAALLQIPLAHISGGDVTQGAADDWFRHCLTKMACVHFPSCEEYAQRVIRMGEAPETVHNVGGLGDENLRNLPLMDEKTLSESLGFALDRPFALVTFHPETAGEASPVRQFEALLAALEPTGLACIFTKANADAGGADINACIDAACDAHPGRYIAFASMGVLRYLSAMRLCAAVVGNSSSGVVETPSLGAPTVNIGARQTGRIVCENVIPCAAVQTEIAAALQTALSPAFVQRARAVKSPYNGGDTSGRIVAALEQALYAPGFGAPQAFYDVPPAKGEL